MGTVNERVALRPEIYNSNGPVINTSANSLELRRIIAMMFYKGEQGFFYDPFDLKTQYQDAAGTAAVNASGQPLGLMLDKSKGLVLGGELNPNSAFSADLSGWVIGTAVSATLSNGEAVVTFGGALTSSGNNWFSLNSPVSLGDRVVIEFDATYVSGGPLQVGSSYTLGATILSTENGGSKKRYKVEVTCLTPAANRVANFAASAGTIWKIDNVSVKKIAGNHAYQSTSAARPILQDAPRRIDFDAIDDKLITNLPAQLTNCTVLRAIPNVGTQVKYNQTLPMLYEDSTNHAGLIAINRALTRKEQLRLMDELDKRAGATSLETLTFKTFDNNQEGFVYDPNDLSTMFQDASGTQPVTAAGQPVGLMLDKSKRLVSGLELVTNGNFNTDLTGWLPSLSSTISWQAGSMLVTRATIGTYPAGGQDLNNLVVGKAYKITCDFSNPLGLDVYLGFGGFLNVARSTATSGKLSCILLATVTSHKLVAGMWGSSGTVGQSVSFDNVSVRELSGNHAYQTTSASRPILRQNATTGAYYLEFDGVDDYLQLSLPTIKDISIVGALTSKVAKTNPIVARGVGGYPYITGAKTILQGGASINYVNPEVFVATVREDQAGAVTGRLRNRFEDRSSTLAGYAFSNNNPVLIGGFSVAAPTPAAIDLYGIVLISKVLSETEGNNLLKHFHNRLGVQL